MVGRISLAYSLKLTVPLTLDLIQHSKIVRKRAIVFRIFPNVNKIVVALIDRVHGRQ